MVSAPIASSEWCRAVTKLAWSVCGRPPRKKPVSSEATATPKLHAIICAVIAMLLAMLASRSGMSA